MERLTESPNFPGHITPVHSNSLQTGNFNVKMSTLKCIVIAIISKI